MKDFLQILFGVLLGLGVLSVIYFTLRFLVQTFS